MKSIVFLACAAIAAAQPATVQPSASIAQRMLWTARTTFGPSNITAGLFTTGLATLRNRPVEYGTHWDGFGKRNLVRLGGALTSTLIEASIGSLWGEDPRYRRSESRSPHLRLWHAVRMSFLAYNRDGKLRPAYARFAAIPVSNALVNQWRPESQRNPAQTSARISMGFTTHIISNLFTEFRPRKR
jgi:hypothetical protein